MTTPNPVLDALQRAADKQPQMLQAFREKGVVFATRINKPWAERTDAERWEAVAFSLYNELVDINLDAQSVLDEVARDASESPPTVSLRRAFGLLAEVEQRAKADE